MENILPDFDVWLSNSRHDIDKEDEKLTKKAEHLNGYRKALNVAERLHTENENLHTENENLIAENKELRRQNQEEKDARAKAEMQLNEMSKLSAGVVRKSSQDEVLKAVRTFINKSKQKTSKKRTLIKEMVLEFACANGILLPEELAQAVYSLDDELEVPAEVHNHFETGSNSQVFNEKVVGAFSGV